MDSSETTGDKLQSLPSVNGCLSKESLRGLDRKMVRFDGVICDQFEEEYFIAVVPAKGDAERAPLVHKYFSEISE